MAMSTTWREESYGKAINAFKANTRKYVSRYVRALASPTMILFRVTREDVQIFALINIYFYFGLAESIAK